MLRAASAGFVPLDQALANYGAGREVEDSTRLLLRAGAGASSGRAAEVALVSEERSWVAEVLYALYVLSRAGIVSWTLQLHPQPAGASSEGPAAAAAATAAGSAPVHVSGRRAARGGKGNGKAAAGRGRGRSEEKEEGGGCCPGPCSALLHVAGIWGAASAGMLCAAARA